MSSLQAPLVSVIMPAFNAAATVRRSVESLQQQTLRDIEIVVVNDGSTDETSSILAELASGDERLRVLERANNEGLVHSLQEGLAVSRAPLIARLDADDVAHPGRLELQVESFRQRDIVLSATAYRRVQPDGASVRDSHPPTTHGGMAAALLVANRLCHSSVMFRRDAALAGGGYRAEWYPVEDYDLWLRLMELGRFEGVDEVLVDYLENPLGVSSSSAVAQQGLFLARRSEYRIGVIGSDVSPTGSPRVAARAHRRLTSALGARGISTAGLDEQCYLMAMGGPGSLRQRQLRMVAAPTLVWRGRRR